MTASLHHARPLLSAAINSGFRESGVQSLKNLDDPEACPMVAIRTAGLGLEAIIASVAEEKTDGLLHFQHLVPKDYRMMLLRISNERFKANTERIERLRRSLRESMRLEERREQDDHKWESRDARRRRKREEGLQRKDGARVAEPADVTFKSLISSEDDQGFLQLRPDD
jgi:tRNA wybutosine-synthesizing protein 3